MWTLHASAGTMDAFVQQEDLAEDRGSRVKIESHCPPLALGVLSCRGYGGGGQRPPPSKTPSKTPPSKTPPQRPPLSKTPPQQPPASRWTLMRDKCADLPGYRLFCRLTHAHTRMRTRAHTQRWNKSYLHCEALQSFLPAAAIRSRSSTFSASL